MMGIFNYIAFGNRDYIACAGGRFEMGRGRMFEYTPVEIEKGLKDLSPEAIEFLEALPTFLCSEIFQSGNATSMLVRYGRIENTIPGPKDVATTFRTLINFGELHFVDVSQARNIFGADKVQLYRTHWAVRKGDAGEILKSLAQLKPELTGAVESQLHRDHSATKPPQHKKITLGTASNVEEFLGYLYALPEKGGVETFFRGHENADYELRPSLLRKSKDGAWLFMPSEDRLCKETLIAHDDEFQGDHFCFDRLVRMQHYGLPTRLLDISSNPLIALFFACTSSIPDINGEVVILRVLSETIKYYDSDTVSCLSHLSNLTHEQRNRIDLKLPRAEFNRTDAIQKLVHHIKSEKSFFEARVDPDSLQSVVCVKAKRTNTRIISQSGAFLLFGHDAELLEAGKDGMEISRVTITNKQHILKQLDRININATTVYPSMVETTLHLRTRYASTTP